MYVHLGDDLVVTAADVVAILDVRLLRTSELTREFVDRAVRGHRIFGNGISPDSKALVVTTGGVYASAISPQTLARRMTHLRQHVMAWGGENAG